MSHFLVAIVNVDLDKINLHDISFDEDDPETIIHIKLMAGRNRYKQRKSCEKGISKEMPVAWPPTR